MGGYLPMPKNKNVYEYSQDEKKEYFSAYRNVVVNKVRLHKNSKCRKYLERKAKELETQ